MALLDNKKIGNRLKAKREEMNEDSLRKFAMRAGIDQSQYSKIEKGELPITENILDKLVTTYGYNKDFILFGTIVPHETQLNEDQPPYNKKTSNLDAMIESNRMLAESNLKLARSHEELVLILKEEMIANAAAKNFEDVVANIQGIREFVTELGAEVRSESVEKTGAVLGTKMAAAKTRLQKRDTLSGEGK